MSNKIDLNLNYRFLNVSKFNFTLSKHIVAIYLQDTAKYMNLNTQYSLYSLCCQEALAGYNLAGGREKTAHSPLTFVQESHCTQWDI